MDEMLATLNRIYPNSGFVLIPKYNPSQWENREYDSSFDTKASINRWSTNPLSYEKAQNAVSEGYRIGWIVPKGMCIIDIDNKEEPRSQEYLLKLLKKFQVKYSCNYTFHGIHLLFRDPKNSIKSDSKCKCGINLVIDTRANGTGYIILPCNDPHRSWGEWHDFVDDLPYFLLPIVKDNTASFIGMADQDGRNTALFKWKTRLESNNKLSAVDIDKCIRIINENLFALAITNEELFKTVLREKNKKEVSDVKDNLYNKIAEDMVAKYDIISYGDQFYRFNGTYYKQLSSQDVEQLIHFDISKNIAAVGRKEIMSFLLVKTQVSVDEFDKDWYLIAVKNGVLNLVNGDVSIANKTDINTIYIPYAYNADPIYSPRIDQFMKELSNGDPVKMQFLYQIAGYCLLKKNMFEKFIIFQGEGGTGKSTYVNLLQRLVGDNNCSHIGLPDFDKDYYLAMLPGKIVNIDDDVVDGKTMQYTGRFKSIVSGNIISVRQIYKEVRAFVPYVKCLFCCNKLPRILDSTSGLYRRMILIELNNKVAKPDPLFMAKISDDDMEYFLFKAVEGIKIAIEEGHFRVSQSEDELLNLFKRRQNPVSEWLYENQFTLGDLVNKRCLPLYTSFSEWSTLNGYKSVCTSFVFKEQVCSLYDMELDFDVDENDCITSLQLFKKRGKFDPMYKPF